MTIVNMKVKRHVSCEGCFSGRHSKPDKYYAMSLCWVCKLRLRSPMWFLGIIDFFDRRGSQPPKES